MPTRREEQDLATTLQALVKRIATLEATCANRVLPPGYRFGTTNADGTGNITIVRLSDGATEVITSL